MPGNIGFTHQDSSVRVARIDGAEFFTREAPTTATAILNDDIERVRGLIERGKLSEVALASRAAELGNIQARWDQITDWMTAARKALCRPMSFGSRGPIPSTPAGATCE